MGLLAGLSQSSSDGALDPPALLDSVSPYQFFQRYRKKVRTATGPTCLNIQVKAIRAAARFSYLLFLLRALPESFFCRQTSPLPRPSSDPCRPIGSESGDT